jgi:hypothetical protein
MQAGTSSFDPSPRPSPPNHAVAEIQAIRGGEGETLLAPNRIGAVLLAQAKATEPQARTPEEKKRVRSAVVLLSVLSGIALSGLLMIIAAIAIRGLQRKLAGPTRLDRDPRDLFPMVPPRSAVEAPPVVPPAEVDQSSEETRLT